MSFFKKWFKCTKKVYYVGQWVEHLPHQWEIQGIFSTEEKAVKACTHDTYFVTEANLDEELPHETVYTRDFTRTWFPKLEKAPK